MHRTAQHCVALHLRAAGKGRRMPAEPKPSSKSTELHYQQKHVLRGHSKSVVSVKFSPNGLWLASASADATLKIWDVQSGQLLRTCEGHIKVRRRPLLSTQTATCSDESIGPSLHEVLYATLV